MVVDAGGSTQVRFDRRCKALCTTGGNLAVPADARGNFRQSSQTLRDVLSIDTEARDDDVAAIQYAQSLFKGTAKASATRNWWSARVVQRRCRPMTWWYRACAKVHVATCT